MNFDANEKKLLKMLVQKELETVKDEGDTVLIVEDHPDFLAGEERYEEFLERLLNKL